MNVIDRWELTVTVRDPERKKFWLEWLGTDTVPVTSEKTVLVGVPGHPSVEAYMLDIHALSKKQIDSLITGLAKNFGEKIAEVGRTFWGGVPILAKDVVVWKDGKVVTP